MKFSDALEAATPRKAVLLVDRLLAEMEDADEARKALLDPSVPSRAISRAFRKLGKQVSPEAVRKWREVNT